MKTEYRGLEVKTLGGDEVSTHHYTLTQNKQEQWELYYKT
jgi:hypothetical protein